jgi:hypothetical protein
MLCTYGLHLWHAEALGPEESCQVYQQSGCPHLYTIVPARSTMKACGIPLTLARFISCPAVPPCIPMSCLRGMPIGLVTYVLMRGSSSSDAPYQRPPYRPFYRLAAQKKQLAPGHRPLRYQPPPGLCPCAGCRYGTGVEIPGDTGRTTVPRAR